MLMGISQLKGLKFLKLSLPFLGLDDTDAESIASMLEFLSASSLVLLLKKNKISKIGGASIAKALSTNKNFTKIKMNLSS